MNTDKWIVEEQVIRKIPEMDEPKAPTVTNGDYFLAYGLIKKYEHDMEAYNQALASMPTYPRGDNGKWKVGQILTECEFEVASQNVFHPPTRERLGNTGAMDYTHGWWKEEVAVPKVEQSKETELEALKAENAKLWGVLKLIQMIVPE